MRRIALVLVGMASALGPASAAEEASRVMASVDGPKQGRLGRYRGHEGHPTVRYTARINTGATTFGLVHWADVDKSHAPKVLPLEGMIGLSHPTPQNWYTNGFMRLYVGQEQVGEGRGPSTL